MIKKFKRYIYGLTYEESMKILIGICIIIALLITDLFTSTSYFTHIMQSDNFLEILFLLLVSLGTLLLVIILLLYFYILNIFEKKLIKQDMEATSILKNAAKSSNHRIFEVIPYNNNQFIMEVINFYREQKNIYNYEEKDLRFWLYVEEVIEDVSNIKIKLYITDKDNPNQKIYFPLDHLRPFYILKNFKIK